MLSQFGFEGSRAVYFVIAAVIIFGLAVFFALVLRRITSGRLMLPGQDRARSRQPRLGIVDIYDLDRQRQLILLRRDNVEHLLLVGGPNDLVVENNIVRVPGARLPANAAEPVMDRPDPGFDQAPPRPQVEPSGRPSIETQFAAQLGSFARRPSEESDIEEELAPVVSVSAPLPQPQVQAMEPVLKPSVVEPVASSAPFADFKPFTPEPPAPAPIAPPSPPPAPPVPRVEPRFSAPPFTAQRPVPPPMPAVEPEPEPEPVHAPEAKEPDADVLSNMAKQLEEALKRPTSAPAPASPAPVEEIEEEEDYQFEEPEEPAPAQAESPRPPEPVKSATAPVVEPPRPAAEPVRTAPIHPAPAPTPPMPTPPATSQAKPAGDPFSVEEIEAEFARLLGRPGEKT